MLPKTKIKQQKQAEMDHKWGINELPKLAIGYIPPIFKVTYQFENRL